MGERKLYKEGLLTKAKSGRRLRAFLCSDILVLTDENQRNLYRMVCVSTIDSAQVVYVIISQCLYPRRKSRTFLVVEVRSALLQYFSRNLTL